MSRGGGGGGLRDLPPSAAARGRAVPGWAGGAEGTRGDLVTGGEWRMRAGRRMLGGRCWAVGLR